MKLLKRNITALLLFAVCLSFSHEVPAKEEYTYTVTFYAGNQGTFVSSAGVSVRYHTGSIAVEPDKITVSGLKIGDIVSFDAQAGAIDMSNSGKFYIKGIRESGRDNNTVTASAFKVEGDADYVTAYGIKGDVTAYKVHYRDESGAALAEDQTYYGNVGDKAVAAYLYIEGYTPQALAITKTLKANETENDMTFVYVKDRKENDTNGTSGGTTGGSAAGENLTGSTTPGTTGGNTTGGNTTGGNTTGGGTAGAAQGETNGTAAEDAENTDAGQNDPDSAEAGEDDAASEETGETVYSPDGEVPLDQELLNLDEKENVPLNNIKLDDKKVKKGMPLAGRIGTGAAAAAALFILIAAWKKHGRTAKARIRKREKNEK